MNLKSERLQLQGAAGIIEAILDKPMPSPLPAVLPGIAIIAHPHPLYGGTMENKVVQTLARAFVQRGWDVLRFNFRGVGRSAGVHDNGVGEASDLIELARQWSADRPLALAGFSFGAFVAAKAVLSLMKDQDIERLVLVGTAVSRFDVPSVPPTLTDRSLVIHGEDDEVVPLSSVMDWARPQSMPVMVVPATGHFFHGNLTLLRNLVVRHLSP